MTYGTPITTLNVGGSLTAEQRYCSPFGQVWAEGVQDHPGDDAIWPPGLAELGAGGRGGHEAHQSSVRTCFPLSALYLH